MSVVVLIIKNFHSKYLVKSDSKNECKSDTSFIDLESENLGSNIIGRVVHGHKFYFQRLVYNGNWLNCYNSLFHAVLKLLIKILIPHHNIRKYRLRLINEFNTPFS